MDALWQGALLALLIQRSCSLSFAIWSWWSCLILDSYRHVVVARVVDIDWLNGAGRGNTYATMRVLRHRGLLHFPRRLHSGIVIHLATLHGLYLIFRRGEQLDVGRFVIKGYGWWELVILLSTHGIKASVADHITQLAWLLSTFLTLLIWAFCCNLALILKLTYAFSSVIIWLLRCLNTIISLKFVFQKSIKVIISLRHLNYSVFIFGDTTFTHNISTINEALTHQIWFVLGSYLLNHFR